MSPSPRSSSTKRFLVGAAIAGAIAGTAGIAAAQSGTPSTTAPAASAQPKTEAAETPLTGDAADKVKAAALAAVPGATVDRSEAESDGSFEAHITKSDGTKATVKVD